MAPVEAPSPPPVDVLLEKYCTYVTLVTQASYLPGAIILAHSLYRCGSRYPLIVLTTPSLTTEAKRALQIEITLNPLLRTRTVEPLIPPERPSILGSPQCGSAAARFRDTYTKLRVFDLQEFKRVVFLDADMLCLQSPDELFSTQFPDGAKLLATEICACNLDNDLWCPASWTPNECPFTHLEHWQALKTITSGPQQAGGHDKEYLFDLEPAHMLNSGTMVFEPSEELWTDMMEAFKQDQKLQDYPCPDQDFLSHHLRGRWARLSWKFNALKTMRYWHGNLWGSTKEFAGPKHMVTKTEFVNPYNLPLSDVPGAQDVVILHYIVDKPWASRIASDGISGYLGRDGQTHRWWWTVYKQWRAERLEPFVSTDQASFKKVTALLATLEQYVQPELDFAEDERVRARNAQNRLPFEVPCRPGMHPAAYHLRSRIWDGVKIE